MVALETLKVAVIGAGTIGGALARELALAGCQVRATRRRLEKVKDLEDLGVYLTSDNVEAVTGSDVVFVVLKPHKVVPVLEAVGEALEGRPVVSLAAALDLDLLRQAFPAVRWIRAMSNTAIPVRQAFTMYAPSPETTERDLAIVQAVFGLLGSYEEVEDGYMDALTAMAGSGPAYIYTMLEALIYGGLRVGLPRDLTLRAAAHTAIGASRLLLTSGEHPAVLRDQVVTPGGVTIEGIFALEEGQIRTAFMNAVKAATEKSQDLAEETRRKIRKGLPGKGRQ
ncbi:MAG: pyrroline-5-carboxylate reductase [Synergistaceae bacterium]|nr:pyrroline-5-carboxylate reductase [Synergistaceae bacterium]